MTDPVDPRLMRLPDGRPLGADAPIERRLAELEGALQIATTRAEELEALVTATGDEPGRVLQPGCYGVLLDRANAADRRAEAAVADAAAARQDAHREAKAAHDAHTGTRAEREEARREAIRATTWLRGALVDAQKEAFVARARQQNAEAQAAAAKAREETATAAALAGQTVVEVRGKLVPVDNLRRGAPFWLFAGAVFVCIFGGAGIAVSLNLPVVAAGLPSVMLLLLARRLGFR